MTFLLLACATKVNNVVRVAWAYTNDTCHSICCLVTGRDGYVMCKVRIRTTGGIRAQIADSHSAQ